MRDHMARTSATPGAASFDEGSRLLYTAATLVELGDPDTELIARETIAGTPVDHHQAHGLAWATIGRSLAGRDPGAAADAGLRALDAVRTWPEVSVEDRVRRLHRDLAARHRGVAEVARLGAACGALQHAHDV
jgi:hypothetical protein